MWDYVALASAPSQRESWQMGSEGRGAKDRGGHVRSASPGSSDRSGGEPSRAAVTAPPRTCAKSFALLVARC